MSITQALIADSIAQAFLEEFEAQAPITRRFLERLPEDKLTWKPHEKSMTAGQLAFHIASTPGGVVRFVQTNPAQAPDFAAFPQPASREEILRKFDESVAIVREILPTIDDAAMTETWRLMAGGKEVLAQPRRHVPARRDVQPRLSASRPIQRLSADAQRSGTRELGTECGRATAVHAERLIGNVEEEPMCPFCLATAAVVAASATGTGGVAALFTGKLLRRASPKNIQRKIPTRRRFNMATMTTSPEAVEGGLAQRMD